MDEYCGHYGLGYGYPVVSQSVHQGQLTINTKRSAHDAPNSRYRPSPFLMNSMGDSCRAPT